MAGRQAYTGSSEPIKLNEAPVGSKRAETREELPFYMQKKFRKT
jgi:hypothetical protein